MIQNLFKAYSISNIMHLRFLVLVIVGFAEFLRISELLSIWITDIEILQDQAQIFLPDSKCDQRRGGNTVYIAKTNTATCPVFCLDKYLKDTNLISEPESYLFCRLYKTRKGHNAHGNKPLSYTRARETFMEHIKVFEEKEVKKFGLHSLRSGGASAATDNEVDERLIGKHGRWSCNSSMEGYIKDSKKT